MCKLCAVKQSTLKLKQNSTPQHTSAEMEQDTVLLPDTERGKKKKPQDVILAMKQLSLLKPVLTPKVKISDELFPSLYPHPLLPYNVLYKKSKHFGLWKPKATSVLLQQ